MKENNGQLFERYRNDNEYIKLWVAYADLVPDPADIFKFLHSHRIGEDIALLYMAWGWVAEARGNYAFADKVYQRGIARKANPIERLQSRYRDFQRRMYRKWIDSQSSQTSSVIPSSTTANNSTKLVPPTQFNFDKDFSNTVDLEALSIAIHGNNNKPTNNTLPTASNNNSSRVPITTNNDENNSNRERAPLGRITADAAARVHRERAYADDNAYANSEERVHEIAASTIVSQNNRQQSSSTNNNGLGSHFPSRATVSSTASTTVPSRSTVSSSLVPHDDEVPVVPIRNPNNNANVPVSIYVEEPFINNNTINSGFIPFHDELGTQINKQQLMNTISTTTINNNNNNNNNNNVWKDLGTEAGRKKENTMLPTKWSDAPLVHHAGTREFETNVKHDNANSRIPVFIDQELQDKVEPVKSNKINSTGGLVERPVVVSSSTATSNNHIESLIANPLVHFQNQKTVVDTTKPKETEKKIDN